MTKTIIQTWWLLALCGLLDGAYSATNFFMQHPDGSLALRNGVHYRSTLVQMGVLALAAGICAIAAGLWSSERRKSWLLVLNGLASSALGLLLAIWTGRIAFRTVALLIVAMAMSIGLYALATARKSRRHPKDAWFLGLTGTVSIGFALSFLALGFGWIKLIQSSPTLLWIGSYFALSAVCMLGLALAGPSRLRPVGRPAWIGKSEARSLTISSKALSQSQAQGSDPRGLSYAVLATSLFSLPVNAACAAANRAIGTRYGEHET